ncbi:helicase-related protein [Geminocystis sp. GBBB08]|uniref:helicase-related protein n=1 Tax=Geminocystis sp. GBBB08 TaxID=2604140 RepID=UPI0027E2989A|nr:helicase-related protein [Geminocystis sp. GBBB08]MBL1210855.1 NgoFVII family restriction endonuclease [Geminocystis sp. GBBB08]
MPRIFDNIDDRLLDSLKYTAKNAYKADFCVGYFNLRGWRSISNEIEKFSGGEDNQCRVLIGMHKLPSTQLYEELKILADSQDKMSQGKINDLKTIIAREFREQLMVGVPTSADEKGLQQLRQQLLQQKVVVKLHLRHLLHAKLYLLYKDDRDQPIIGYLGSSNLTLSGLKYQGELNIDVLDHDATNKLQQWFNDRWNDKFCIDISQELANIIDESWATEKLIPPYYIYIKMAYHLSQEARDGLSQYTIPSEFKLFDFQEASVKIACHHVNRRGGVIIGDVVGLGKTMVGTAIARVLEEDFGFSTLIICPKNLVTMWENYRDTYGLRAKILSISMVEKELENVPARFRLVLIDESHNLRNREGKRYACIKDYIEQSGSRCILLTATPYNKSYLDLSAQLRLFVGEDEDLGIRPEELLRNTNFAIQHPDISPRTLKAFENSEYSEDWQQLMSKYMVRRTRSFIRDNYAQLDREKKRKYLEFADGSRSYFPHRIPKTATFKLGENDPYAKLYSPEVVDIISNLNLPRYALGSYQLSNIKQQLLSSKEKDLLDSLSRAGRNLIGFCRTNLFKRLESSGYAFIESIERHILRNYIYLYAIESGLDIPIGTQDVDLFSAVFNDQDTDSTLSNNLDIETLENEDSEEDLESFESIEKQENIYQEKARKVYEIYQTKYQKRFKWIRPNLFNQDLVKHLQEDAHNLLKILNNSPEWTTKNDQKLLALHQLIIKTHPEEKILIFSQFADTVSYLKEKLTLLGLTSFACATGKSENPTILAQRFSPKSNNKSFSCEQELRVLIATDVLSEGQNLQDCRIIVNYDLPWAIIRLIQRAGRVDRIGQTAEEILCYSFLPADGVEELINLRGRLSDRLRENAEVVGTDEIFFEGADDNLILDLYHEKAGILDDVEDNEVDLVSEALSIWESAKEKYPDIAQKIEQLPNVIYSTKRLDPPQPSLIRDLDPPQPPLTKGRVNTEKASITKEMKDVEVPLTKGDKGGSSLTNGRLRGDRDWGSENPQGVLMYMRTSDGVDALAYVNENGNSVTQSQNRILRLARCELETKPIARHPDHFDLVDKGAKIIAQQQKKMAGGGKLGSPNGARAKTYNRLNGYIDYIKNHTPLLAQGQQWDNLIKAVEDIYNYPLRESSIARLNRQLRSGIKDQQLANMVVSLWEDSALCVTHEDKQVRDNQIICSLGLFS